MSLKHAILGFLNYNPLSGYDLKRAFDISVRHFWLANQSQIYRTLAELAESGWAEMEIVEQQDHPDRKVYHITEAGREELRRWLAVPLPHTIRLAELIQVFFAGQLSDAEILAMLKRMAEPLRELLERYSHVPQESQVYAETVGSPREVFFWMLTLEFGIINARTQLEWLESAIRRIENKQHPPK